MAKKRSNYKVYDTLANLGDGTGGTTVIVRKVSWFGGDVKVDIRKWYNHNLASEAPGHGVALDTEAADVLTESLVRSGYGRKELLEELLKTRTEIDREPEVEEDEAIVDKTKCKEEKEVKTTDEFYSAKDLLSLEYQT